MAYDASIGVNLYGRDVSASKALNGVGKSAKSAGEYIKEAGRRATYVFGAIAGAAVMSAKAAASDANAQRILAVTLQNTTKATKAQVQGVEDYITKTQLAIGITDDELRTSFARLTLSTNNLQKSQQLLNLALDIKAAKPTKSLESIVNALGKAYDGNATSLGRLGLGIDASVLKSKNFDKIYKVLANTFRDFAKSEANTTEAKTRRLTIAMNELRESIGYALLPTMEKLLTLMTKLVPWFEKHQKIITPLILTIGGLAAVVMAVAAAVKVYETALAVATAAQVIFNAVVMANPIGLLVAGVAALIGVLVVLFNKNKTFHDNVVGIIELHKKIFGAVADFFTQTIPQMWDKFIRWLSDVPSRLKGFGAGIIDAMVSPFKAAFNQIAWLWNNTVGKIHFTIPGWIPKIGGSEFGFPKIPMLAEGGIVTGPTLAMIGEAGPEAVVPLKDGPFGGGINVTINVTGSLVTQKELVQSIRNEMAQLLRRKGAPISALGY